MSELKRFTKTSSTEVVSGYLVSGAGSSRVDGVYLQTDQERTGSPIYKHKTDTLYICHWEDQGLHRWSILKDDPYSTMIADLFYRTLSYYLGTRTPDQLAWHRLSAGTLPAPSVTNASIDNNHIFTTPVNKSDTIISLLLNGISNSSTINIIKTTSDSTVYSNQKVDLKANLTIIMDYKQFMLSGDKLKINSTANGIQVTANVARKDITLSVALKRYTKTTPASNYILVNVPAGKEDTIISLLLNNSSNSSTINIIKTTSDSTVYSNQRVDLKANLTIIMDYKQFMLSGDKLKVQSSDVIQVVANIFLKGV